MRVWREGERIRNEDGVGYSDRVPDSDIIRHVASAGDDGEAYQFGIAVLGLRVVERAGAAGGETP